MSSVAKQLANFGPEVRRLRQARNLTIEELAERSNLSPNYLGAVERSEKNPTIKTLLAISNALDVPAGALFGQSLGPGSKELSPRDGEMLELFMDLSNELKDIVVSVVRALRRGPRR